MKLNKDAKGIIIKRGDTEIVIAVDNIIPHKITEFWIKTTIKKLPSAEDLVNEK